MANIPGATLEAASAAAGRCLSAASGGVARLRHGRPLHPKGRSYAATVYRDGANTGVPWLDEVGPAEVVARVSRAIGLPQQVPDIYGIAIRIDLADNGFELDQLETQHRVADLLFASTGDTAIGRFVLKPRAEVGTGPLTTLLPVHAPAGPLLLRLAPREPEVAGDDDAPPDMTLAYAIGMRRWNPLGLLKFGAEVAGHDNDRHDPVEHQLPGQQQYSWVKLLREPAYRAARRRGRLARS